MLLYARAENKSPCWKLATKKLTENGKAVCTVETCKVFTSFDAKLGGDDGWTLRVYLGLESAPLSPCFSQGTRPFRF